MFKSIYDESAKLFWGIDDLIWLCKEHMVVVAK